MLLQLVFSVRNYLNWYYLFYAKAWSAILKIVKYFDIRSFKNPACKLYFTYKMNTRCI